MAGLRELRKRLKSIRTTGQLAGAMRTVAAAKYSRVNAARLSYETYAAACREMQRAAGRMGAAPVAAGERPRCWVLFSGNRGLCGGFNAELLNLFYSRYRETAPAPLVIACGKMAAAFCKEKGIQLEREMPFQDVPRFDEAQQLAEYVAGLYASGAVSGVDVLYQRFENMLRQTPLIRQILPAADDAAPAEAEDVLFLPDRETVCERLAEHGFDTMVYAIALEHASGAQAATLMAMRSAYDNAAQSALELETTINRRRQAEVTASVIETASDNVQQQ